MGESLKGEQPVRYRTNQDRHEMIIILRRPYDVLELDEQAFKNVEKHSGITEPLRKIRNEFDP